MKLPKSPPTFADLQKEISMERMLAAVGAVSSHDSKYHHWDKLRFHTAPDGLSTGEWWFALKIRRTGQAIPIPLLDTQGRPFTFFQTELMSPALHKIDLGAGGMIGTPEPVTNEATKNYYYVSSLIREAITSSQLEGAVVTREVAKEMIRSEREPNDKGEKMIMNNYRTMQRLAEWKDHELTPALIFEIHKVITEGTLDKEDASGRLRLEGENVEIVDERDYEVLHSPPSASELEQRLDKLCAFANDTNSDPFVHPVIRAIILHFCLAYDHPFVDGNGRTARALFYWSMLRQGFWLFEFLSISEILVNAPVKYARSYLLTETDDNDLNYFIHYQLEVIQKSIQNLHSFIDKKSKEVDQVRTSLLNLSTPLNHRQETIINKASREPNSRFTAQSHQMSHRISYGTARSDLMNLEKLKLLISRKHGKTYYYYPAPDLRDKLSSL
ncbi:Fic family protein [Rubritalea tangerina]|uniref:Fic family protein n=2 Tax=Rubritalea tangerina TaxID=430798 RepID=A0ABW4Z9U3_9BACT